MKTFNRTHAVTKADCYKRLGAAILLEALQNLQEANGDGQAIENWLLHSQMSELIMSSLNLGNLNIQPVVEKAKSGELVFSLAKLKNKLT